MVSKPATVDRYLAGFPPDVKAVLEKLRAAIKKAAPRAEERISYGIAGYDYHGMLVYFAGWTRHVGFYPASGTVFQAFRKELASFPQSQKGTVQFPLDRPLPLALITKMVRYRLKENDERQALKAATARSSVRREGAKPRPKGTLRVCPKGHRFFKSSDCPTCPLCGQERKPAAAFLEGLGAPARRALEGAGLTTPARLAKLGEKEVLALHGMGPASLPALRAALKAAGHTFRKG